MAAQELSSTRRRVLGAAVALPVIALAGLPAPTVIASMAKQASRKHETWHRRLARYRRLHTGWKVEAESGAFRAAHDEYNRARAELSARFGSWEKARRSRIGRPLCRAAFARVDAAEDAFYDRFISPMQLAAACLIRTPVPDLDALLTKIEVILTFEVDTRDGTAPYPWNRLREDIRRLPASRGQLCASR